MARPTLITVKGTYLKLDGTPEAGTIQFFSPVTALKSGTGSAVVASDIKVTLDNTGSFEVQVPASNDPAWIPNGWTYRVVMRLTSEYSTFNTVIPYNAVNGTVFITDLLPAQPGGSALYAAFNHVHGNYAPSVHTHEADQIVSGTIALARLPVGVAPGTIAAGDHTHTFDSVWAAVNHNHDTAYAPLNHNHDSAYSVLGHTHNYADLIGIPPGGGTVDKAALGLDNVDNTSDLNKPVSTAQQAALDLKANINNPTFTGTVSGITKNMVGLGNVDNTSDVDKPVSNAQQDALDLKANINNPTFTGTVSGISKAMVGLGSVDNTSDANKPVSTAQQTALNLKLDKTDPALAVAGNLDGLLTTGEEIIPRKDVSFQLQMTSGTFFLSDFVARKTETITKIRTGVSDSTTTGVGGTAAWVAVYSFDGTDYTLVAQSADTPTLWSTAFQVYETPLITPFNKVAGNSYAIGFLWIGSGQAPSLPGTQAWYADTLLTPRICSVFYSQTSLPSPLPAAFTGPDSRKYQAIMLP